jgi:hypothetical protein
MKRNTFFLTAAAILLVLGVSIGSTMAYFSTYTTAQGGKVIHLGAATEIEEAFDSWTKRVTVTSDENSQPVYVRAIAYAGSQYELTYEGTGWSRGDDGYYYYGNALEGGASTEELLVHIGNVPDDAEAFDVVVIYETTPVLYDENGNPYADWSQKVVSDSTEGGQN